MKIALIGLLSVAFAHNSAQDELKQIISQIDSEAIVNPESLAFTHAYKNKPVPEVMKFDAVDVSTYFTYNACRTFCYRKYAVGIERSKF